MNDLLGRAVAAEERARQLEATIQTVWSTRDPRETIGKRARIVVIAGDRVVFGDVETLDHNDPDERRFVGEDEAWPGWFWSTAPRRP